MLGGISVVGFPLVIPAISETPLFEGTPRELAAFLSSGGLYYIATSNRSTAEKFRFGWMAGMTFFVGLLYWLTIAMGEFGGMPWWQIIPVFTLLTGYCALYWGAAAAFPTPLKMREELCALSFALGWVLLEYARGHLLTGFPWGELGYSQARALPLAQWASIGGVHLVTFIVALGGALFVNYIRLRRTPKMLSSAIYFALYFATTWGGGHLLLRHIPPAQGKLEVGVIQGNIAQSVKNKSSEHRDAIISTYLDGSIEALGKGAERLVWPEAAWPNYLPTKLQQFPLGTLGAPLYAGAPAFERKPSLKHYNSVFWVDASGSVGGRQDKNHLVPFGEYVPMRWLLPVERFVPGLLDFSRGEQISLLGSPPAGVLICFDGVFPKLAAQATKSGAGWLINATNDGWYGISSAPYQHHDFYIFRAIENRRWVVRAANTGLSSMVDARGILQKTTALNQQTTLVGPIEIRQDLTLYSRYQDRWIGLAAMLLAFLFGLGRFRRRRSSS